MADDRALIAHLLRRTGFGPHPGQVDELARAGYAGALDRLLAATPLKVGSPSLGTKDDDGLLIRWWLEVMARPDAGLHEKMVWFWHGHLTSSVDKTQPVAMERQHQLFRTHALGNARELLQAVTVDAAMLDWLDGGSSTAESPNENYGRELMELFALGREFKGTATYSPADVQAAAYALSGWQVNDDKGSTVSFASDRGPARPVQFLGTSVVNAKDVVNTVCDHPAFAPFLARKLYIYFHGVVPDAATVAALADGFRNTQLEVRPLVVAILTDPAFVEHRMTRPRSPVEWALAAQAVLGPSKGSEVHDVLDLLGQVPFQPPNVAGWPILTRWLSAGGAMARAAFALSRSVDSDVTSTADPVTWILNRASLFEISDTTAKALARAATRIESNRDRATALHALALSSPEFALA